ncbi:MAG: NAD-dependent epimerase/dehydratase family protein [Gemmatimonadaceae bacterium]
MKIALLGAGGFIGSHLVEGLLAWSDHTVEGMDLTGEKLEEITAALAPSARKRWTFHEADIRQAPDLVRSMVRGADVVVDLIAHANPSLYVTRPLDVFELNFMQNLEVARLCIAHRAWLIQYSSAEVYGKASGTPYAEDETDAVFGPVSKQRWIYAVGKHLLERVLYAHGEAGELTYTIVRPFNFLGPRIDYLVPPGATGGPRVFPHFMSALLGGGPMRLVDGGHAHRAFLHAADGTAAFRAILEQPERARNAIFNVGNPGNDTSIRDLALLMLELYEELTGEPPRSPIEDISGEAFYGAGYEDSDREVPNITKIRSLGWAPTHDLRTTVRDTMSHYLRAAGRPVIEARAPAERG